MEIVRVRFTVRGRVQGVGFRYFARRHAEALGVNGWIRNCFDGTVEGVVEGYRDKVEDFLALCRRGPSSAHVEEVEVQYE